MTPTPAAEGSARGLQIAVVLLLAAVVGLYVAGGFYLWSIKLPPAAATPWTVVQYWQGYGDRPDVRRGLAFSLMAGMGLSMGGAVAAVMPRRRPLHGDARFATRREIAKAKLLGEHGIILGRYGKRYLMLPGQQGAELEAPPRSGKGVGVVIPNLLNWPGSVIVSDVKGENWTRTAGYRAANGQEVHLFDPLSEAERSARWNPLAYVSEVPYRCIDDLQRIATMLYPDPQGADPFWTSSARSLFLGIALYLFETEGSIRTVGEILRQGMASDAEGFQKHWRRVIESCERAGYPLSHEAVQTLYDVIDLAPVTASSIRKTFTSRLDLWLNPLIDAATSGNDFDFRALRKRPISIYARINPDNIARLQPLLNLFFQQAIGLQTRELPEENPALKCQVLLVLDEFAALGRIPVIANATAFLPGYNVRALVIVQSHSQLVEKYGIEGAKSIRKMLAARIVFPPKEFDDAEAISKELGTYTVRQKGFSRPMWGGRSPTVNISEQPRRLLLAQEVKNLGPDRMLLFYEGLRPVLGRRITYYRDKYFAKRELLPPEVPKLDVAAVRAMPTTQERKDAEDGGFVVEHIDRTAGRQPKAIRVGDLEHLKLEDFSLDFSKVEIPKGRPMTDAEVSQAVDQFMATLAD
ncbi:MAG: type IV secretory system conjugative DNA transfer family protein [Proteobacteria bacterium]|nr:type IV secretory system conjugative DNA transfer family protein [Pseudomonadota bacterium]